MVLPNLSEPWDGAAEAGFQRYKGTGLRPMEGGLEADWLQKNCYARRNSNLRRERSGRPPAEIPNEERDLESWRNKGQTGAPGEIRTPDLQLRRQSECHRPSKNQWLTVAPTRQNEALSAAIEHILNTIFSSRRRFGAGTVLPQSTRHVSDVIEPQRMVGSCAKPP
jgi:hypothetical protein